VPEGRVGAKKSWTNLTLASTEINIILFIERRNPIQGFFYICSTVVLQSYKYSFTGQENWFRI
jgi:hypothetical protein